MGISVLLNNGPVNGCLYYTVNTFVSPCTGDEMGGLTIRATFTDSSTETASWVGNGDGLSGQATGASGWSLACSNNSFPPPPLFLDALSVWTLTNSTGKGITQLLFDAGAGLCVFGHAKSLPFSPGAGTGEDFTSDAGHGLLAGDVITATYSGQVALTGAQPVGDEYRFLTLDFTNAGGFGGGRTLNFGMDTDAVDVVPVCVPEPVPPEPPVTPPTIQGIKWLGNKVWLADRKARALKKRQAMTKQQLGYRTDEEVEATARVRAVRTRDVISGVLAWIRAGGR
jgi:hypothetical protein